MKIVEPSVTICNKWASGKDVLRFIEEIGRTCYRSEDKITEDSAEKFVRMILRMGHESVLEHYSITVRFVCDRGVSHELVRHRIASFSQESTRYCNYGSGKFGTEITVVRPSSIKVGSDAFDIWCKDCEEAERSYMAMLSCGCKPEQARSVLPNSLKTEIVMTANLREWRHFLKLRTSEKAHPDMREVANELLDELKEYIPVVFEDIVGSGNPEEDVY